MSSDTNVRYTFSIVAQSEAEYKAAVYVYESSRKEKSADLGFDKKSIEYIGRTWFVPREVFAESTFSSLLASVHCFVIAFIDTLFAAIKGEGFQDDELNDLAIKSWKQTGKCIQGTVVSAVGIAIPKLSISLNKKINDFLDGKKKETKKPEEVEEKPVREKEKPEGSGSESSGSDSD